MGVQDFGCRQNPESGKVGVLDVDLSEKKKNRRTCSIHRNAVKKVMDYLRDAASTHVEAIRLEKEKMAYKNSIRRIG